MAAHFRESPDIAQGRILFAKEPKTARKGLFKGILVFFPKCYLNIF